MDHQTAGQSTAASLPIVQVAAAAAEAEASGTKTTPPPTSLAPGFRFHPTDQELVGYYLKRKVSKKPMRFDAIGEVDIYNNEPWDLAGYSRLKTKDQEWYFFILLDKKYGHLGNRMNRSTAKGFWKATGKEREVRNDSQLIGMKKILVFHTGARSNGGQRTNWVMHEYRLVESEEKKYGTGQEAYVVCRIYHKNNKGPPKGDQYAPFIEEDWDDGEAAIVPGVDTVDEVAPVDDVYTERNNVEQDPQSIYMGPLSVNNKRPSVIQNLLPIHNEPPSVTTQNLLPLNNEPSSETRETLNLLPVNNEPPSETLNLLPVCKSERVEDVTLEAPFPLYQHKRRRHEDSNYNHSNDSENSTRATQDLFSRRTTATATMATTASTSTASENSTRATQDLFSWRTTAPAMMATTASTSMALATTMPIPPLSEFLFMESLEPKEINNVCHLAFNIANLDSSVPSSISNIINDLQKEVHKLFLEREKLKLEMKSAQATINILKSQLDLLSKENENLKRIRA